MLKNLVLVSAIALALPACSVVGVATGVGATAGLSAAQEGGLSRAASDALIQAEINNAWFNYDVNVFTKLDITVNQGRVLVTGIVQNPQHRVDAIRLIWQVDGVKQVINEVQVAESGGFSGFLQDNYILTRLRTKITLDKEIQSLNYNIDTVAGVVYLLGVAQDQVELNKVIEAARTISGVRQVVSYVKIAGPEQPAEPFERTYQSSPNQVSPDEQYKQPAIYNDNYNNSQVSTEDNYAPVDIRSNDDVIWYDNAPQATELPKPITGVDSQPLR